METPLPPQFDPQPSSENVPQQNPLPNKRDPWGRVIGVNLLILLAYSVLAVVTNGYAGIFTIFTYLIHVGVLLVLSFVLAILANINKRDYNATAYFVSAGIIFVVGFAACAAISIYTL